MRINFLITVFISIFSLVPAVLRAKKVNGNAILFHDGTTTVEFAEKVAISCSMSSCLFPADSHRCELTLALISHNASEVILANHKSVPAEYLPEPEHDLWTISVGTPTASSHNPLHRPDNWQTATMKRAIRLERKSSFYVINIIVPMLLILLITMSAVLLPKETGEKISLLITCFLAQIVYVDVLLKTFPKTSNYLPVMIGYTTFMLTFTVLQILLSCITAYLAREAESETKSLFRKLAGSILACMKNCVNRIHSTQDITGGNQDRQTCSDTETEETGGRVGSGSATQHLKAVKNEIKDSNEATFCQHKRYKKFCLLLVQIIEESSLFVSFLLLVLIPIFLHLIFSKKIHFFCPP